MPAPGDRYAGGAFVAAVPRDLSDYNALTFWAKATVPVEVAAEGAAAIMILATGNPRPGVATIHFGPLAAASTCHVL